MTAFELELVVLVSLPSLSATMLIRRAAWESDSLHALSKPCAMVLRVRGMKAERWSRDDQVRATSGELLYYPQAKIYDHTLLTKQSYAFDA